MKKKNRLEGGKKTHVFRKHGGSEKINEKGPGSDPVGTYRHQRVLMAGNTLQPHSGVASIVCEFQY